MIQIYYGFGKGKTTAAIGQGVRAKGSGMNVLLVQFLKDNKSSELKELKKLEFDVFEAPDSLPFNPGDFYKEWVDNALNYIKNSNADMIILDEFADIIGSFIDESFAALFIGSLKGKEVVITGHKKVDSLFDSADYITHMEKEKHPFDLGVKARKGIEY